MSVKVEVAVLVSPSLISLVVSVDVKQHLNNTEMPHAARARTHQPHLELYSFGLAHWLYYTILATWP